MIRGEADGTNSEAAAARPTAPSGAENQDNFIVIISLPLSPSLQLMEEGEEDEEDEVEERRGGREGDGEGAEGEDWNKIRKGKKPASASCLVSCGSDAFECVKNFLRAENSCCLFLYLSVKLHQIHIANTFQHCNQT